MLVTLCTSMRYIVFYRVEIPNHDNVYLLKVVLDLGVTTIRSLNRKLKETVRFTSTRSTQGSVGTKEKTTGGDTPSDFLLRHVLTRTKVRGREEGKTEITS